MSKLIIALVSGLFAVSVYAQPAKQAPAGDAVQPKLEKDQRKTETGKGLPTAKDSTQLKQKPAGDAVQPKLVQDQRKAETGKGLPTATDTTNLKQKPAGDAVQPKIEQKQRKDENKPMPAAK
ncbi:MAG: hypothetical protein NT054_06445 [Burkholderiales bacterium]|nr:hypothetical protein [Burkholderiales bacterium]